MMNGFRDAIFQLTKIMCKIRWRKLLDSCSIISMLCYDICRVFPLLFINGDSIEKRNCFIWEYGSWWGWWGSVSVQVFLLSRQHLPALSLTDADSDTCFCSDSTVLISEIFHNSVQNSLGSVQNSLGVQMPCRERERGGGGGREEGGRDRQTDRQTEWEREKERGGIYIHAYTCTNMMWHTEQTVKKKETNLGTECMTYI